MLFRVSYLLKFNSRNKMHAITESTVSNSYSKIVLYSVICLTLRMIIYIYLQAYLSLLNIFYKGSGSEHGELGSPTHEGLLMIPAITENGGNKNQWLGNSEKC